MLDLEKLKLNGAPPEEVIMKRFIVCLGECQGKQWILGTLKLKFWASGRILYVLKEKF